MAESVVNPQSASQLKSRNAEPTHLGGQSYDDLGGRAWDGPAGADGYKIDAAKGVKGKDTSIPASVAAEPTHLSGSKVAEADEPDEIEIEYDGEKKNEDTDDLDKAIDEDDDLDQADVKVSVKESDDDDEDDVKNESDDEDKDDVKNESEDEFPFKKKDDASDDDKNESDDEDKDDVKNESEDEFPFKKKDDDKNESDDEDKDDVKTESLKINIHLPKTSLFESAGFSVKQQKKVASIFESAVKSTTKQLSTQIHEHYRKVHRSKLAEQRRLLESRLNTYLDVVVEEWFTSNEVPLRTTLRSEMAENFLNGLQKLFVEHYIDVPDSKVDVVEALSRENDTLKKKLTEETTQKLKMRRLAEAANKKRIVAEFARNLSEVQAAKLDKLAEDTEYVSAADFREKLTMLKESYFATTTKMSRLPDEDVAPVKEERKVTQENREVDAVADAISRQKTDW